VSEPKRIIFSMRFYGKKTEQIKAFLNDIMLEHPDVLGFEKSKIQVGVNPWVLGPAHEFHLFFENAEQILAFRNNKDVMEAYTNFLGITTRRPKSEKKEAE
jgi:hypothetical protein